MIDLSIKTRVFLLSFIPMLLITSILSVYFLQEQLDEIDNNINDRGKTMAMHLANASEYGMFSGNRDELENLLERFTSEEGIVSISVIDKSETEYISATNDKLTDHSSPNKIVHKKLFRHPIILHTTKTTSLDDISQISTSNEQDEILGWIELAISTNQIDSQQSQIIWNAIIIILSGLVVSILLSLWMGRSLTSPIIRLTQAVHNVEKGDLEEVIETRSSGEIGKLEVGFMSMLGKIRSSQKNLQEKINETTLGLKNTLKTVEKQNIELTEARKKALEASETKTRFLANISHEIRTPMNGILGFARLLKKTQLNREQFEYLDTIEKSSDNLLHLLEDILDISRVEEGKLVIKNKAFNLRNCIEDVIMLMAPAVHEKGLNITYFLYNDVPQNISAPNERVMQVLINYIGNAIKFSEKGTIVVRAMLDPIKNDSIKITVSDQGIGIPDIEKEHIFTPFTQIDDSSTRTQGGTGLGLAISRSITRAMGGDTGLEDNEGSGSTFWFTFPYRDTINTQVSTPLDSSESSIPVLLYDSNPDTLKSIHAQISEAGYNVSDYSDLADILKAQNNYHVKSISILSLSHEEMGGTDIIHSIEELIKYPDSRLILLLSSIDSSATEKVRDCGADACLIKPYRHDELVRSLSTLAPSDEENTANNNISGLQRKTDQILNGINILLAEDNIINTKLIQTVLGKSGANLIHANNGEEAITAFNKDDFDVILMDIQMPVVNGEEATINIRNSGPKGKVIPIIGMTANALPEDITRYKRAGFNDILIKPISVDDLLHEIRSCLKNQEYSVYRDITGSIESSSHNKLGINERLSDDLYKMLINELPQVSSQLQESFSIQDWNSLRKQIHKLLGGLSYCNVKELEKQTLVLQTSLRNEADSLNDDFKALIREIDNLI
ncbi:response regulator [Kaarinaea lacus]